MQTFNPHWIEFTIVLKEMFFIFNHEFEFDQTKLKYIKRILLKWVNQNKNVIMFVWQFKENEQN